MACTLQSASSKFGCLMCQCWGPEQSQGRGERRQAGRAKEDCALRAAVTLCSSTPGFRGQQLSQPAAPSTANGQSGRLQVRAAKKKGSKPVNKAKLAKQEKEAQQAAARASSTAAPYTDPDVFMHSLLLIDSYQRATGKPLFTGLDLADSGRALFEAPFAVVSHDGEDDPIFDYGNKAALDLFEMGWDDFTKLPSRQSAAAASSEQATRNQLLTEALEKGAVELRNVERYSSTNKSFTIKEGTLWTITDLEGARVGQAAVFFEVESLGADEVEGDDGELTSQPAVQELEAEAPHTSSETEGGTSHPL